MGNLLKGANNMYTIKYGENISGIFSSEKEAEDYITEKKLLNAEVVKINNHFTSKCTDLNKLTSAIKLWSADRNLHAQDHKMQTLKVGEEVGELFKAIVKNDQEELIDAVGDTYVTLVILCQQLGIEIEDCVSVAYNEIKDRKGKLVDGTFIKEATE